MIGPEGARETPVLPARRIWTIGHFTHWPSEFVSLLRRHRIDVLVDVRTVPRSRRVPHFDRDALDPWLAGAGIRYVHPAGLGGWRQPREGSPNLGWRTGGFQGYADHKGTPEFEAGLRELMWLASSGRTAYMCAEGLWWRCHRRLLSDALAARGWEVGHVGPGVRSRSTMAHHEHEPHVHEEHVVRPEPATGLPSYALVKYGFLLAIAIVILYFLARFVIPLIR